MTTSVLILEKSERRREYDDLFGPGPNANLVVENWKGLAVPAEKSLILAHRSNFRPATEDLLDKAADAGSVAVRYTDGSIEYAKREGRHGGWRIDIRWDDLKAVLTFLGRDFTRGDFVAAVDSHHNRHLVNAVAILARCVSRPDVSPAVKRRQAAWLADPARWRDVLGAAPADLRAALLGEPKAAYPEALSELDRLAKWVWPEPGDAPAEPPDFDTLLEQLQARFGFRAK